MTAPAKSPQLDLDLPCVMCGYNLRGLSMDGACPECGAAVRSSIVGTISEWSDEMFRRVARALDWLGGSGTRAFIVVMLLLLAGIVLAIYGRYIAGETTVTTTTLAGLVSVAGLIPLVTIWPWQRMNSCLDVSRFPGRRTERFDMLRGPVFAVISNIAMPAGFVLYVVAAESAFVSRSPSASFTLSLVIMAIVLAWLAHLHWLRAVFADLLSQCTAVTGSERKYVDAGMVGIARGMKGVFWFLVILDFGFCFGAHYFANNGIGKPVLWLIAMPIAQLTHARVADELGKLLKLEREAMKALKERESSIGHSNAH